VTLAPSLEGRQFTAVDNASGEVDASTVFVYHEKGDLVWARYGGGGVGLGFLVGTRTGDELDFRYTQRGPLGQTSTGHCLSRIEQLSDGRLRLDEKWEWESRGISGTSVVEELMA
jgi:hypothetical protein